MRMINSQSSSPSEIGRTHLPELLAPAGDEEALRAAIENGADAIYLGLDDHNARLRASNFSVAQLPDLVARMHERGVRVYVTLNTLIFSDELENAASLLVACSDAGVDGVMIQDLGFAALANRMTPALAIHASTQMTLTSPESVAAVEALGVKLTRVVAPRELDIRQIADLCARTSKEIEVFVHGALCVAYSGQCLTSEALGGRSANRGECAQACRLPYDLIVDGQVHDTSDRKYLLSPKDLAAYDDLPRLVEIGVRSLKIEGRLKNALYVAATVRAYRDALDRLRDSQTTLRLAEEPETRYRLEMTFSRGFTGGYLHRVDHQAVVEGRFPKKRGPYLGRVTRVAPHGITIGLEGCVKLGDGVVFDSGHPDRDEAGGRIYEIWLDGKKVESAGSLGGKSRRPLEVTLTFDHHRFPWRQVSVNDRVWKTSDPLLEKQLRGSYAGNAPRYRRPVTAFVRAYVGEPLRIALRDWDQNFVVVTDDVPLELARQRPLDLELVRQQLGRMGATPFYLADATLDTDGQAMVPVSRLNDLRRRAVQALLDKRRKMGHGRRVVAHALSEMRAEIASRSRAAEPTSDCPTLCVLCRTLDQVHAAAAHPRVTTIYTDFEDLRRHREAGQIVRAARKRFVPATLRIMKAGEEGFLRTLLSVEPDALLVRNLAAWLLLRQMRPGLPLIGDYSLNVANDLTVNLLISHGFECVTPSYDLNGEQLLELLQRVPSTWFEVTIHQHMPMFHMEHCVFCRFLSDGTDYTNCGRPCDIHRVALRDRMGFAHPVKADAGCRNTVYNAVPQSAAEYVPALLGAGVRRFRIEFIEEDNVKVRDAISLYADLLDGRVEARCVWTRLHAIGKLGVTRGTLDHA